MNESRSHGSRPSGERCLWNEILFDADGLFAELYTAHAKNQPLEVTPVHLVYLHGRSDPVAAGTIKVGDSLVDLHGAPQQVTKIRVATRRGFYGPLTEDGTIVVNNMVASCGR